MGCSYTRIRAGPHADAFTPDRTALAADTSRQGPYTGNTGWPATRLGEFGVYPD